MVPCSLVWCGFAIVWTSGAARWNGMLRLFGVPFVAAGLFNLVGRFALDAWFRRRTVYAITDRRVMIRRDGPSGAFVSLDLVRLPGLSLVHEEGARGTPRFGPPSPAQRAGKARIDIPALDEVPRFIAVEGADDVLKRVIEAADAARATGPR